MFMVKSFILKISYVKWLILQMFDDDRSLKKLHFLSLSAFNALDVKRLKHSLLRTSTQSAGQGLGTSCQKCHWCSLYRASTVPASVPATSPLPPPSYILQNPGKKTCPAGLTSRGGPALIHITYNSNLLSTGLKNWMIFRKIWSQWYTGRWQ